MNHNLQETFDITGTGLQNIFSASEDPEIVTKHEKKELLPNDKKSFRLNEFDIDKEFATYNEFNPELELEAMENVELQQKLAEEIEFFSIKSSTVDVPEILIEEDDEEEYEESNFDEFEKIDNQPKTMGIGKLRALAHHF